MERQGAGESRPDTPQRGRGQGDGSPCPACHGRETALPLQRGQYHLSDDCRAHGRGCLLYTSVEQADVGHHARFLAVDVYPLVFVEVGADMRKGSKWLSAFLESYRPPLDGERYLTDGEVSELLRVSRRTNKVYASVCHETDYLESRSLS